MKKYTLMVFLIVLLSFGSVSGQSAQMVLDSVTGRFNPELGGPIGDSLRASTAITFWFRFTNNTGANIRGSSNGFRLYSPDGAVWQIPTYLPKFDWLSDPPEIVLYQGQGSEPKWWYQLFNDNLFVNTFSVTGSGADTIGQAGNSINPSTGIPDGFSEIVYSITTLFDQSEIGKTICLDSCFYPPGGEWLWVADTGIYGLVTPEWNGPFCWTISSCCLGERGNIDFDPEDKTNISDLTYLVEHLFGTPNGPEPLCMEEANVNADPDGSVNISDLTYLVCHLFCVPPGPRPWDCGQFR